MTFISRRGDMTVTAAVSHSQLFALVIPWEKKKESEDLKRGYARMEKKQPI